MRGTLRRSSPAPMFFFSSRRRHTRLQGDWSSDVCSSDLLAPEFFPAVPIDPYDGKSLRYHPNDDGTYLLYSVGEDGRDDGGDPTNVASGSSSFYWQNNRARDWVWPQPATDEEIQNYYDNQSKQSRK